jgi:hypothetical protein
LDKNDLSGDDIEFDDSGESVVVDDELGEYDSIRLTIGDELTRVEEFFVRNVIAVAINYSFELNRLYSNI